MVAYGDAGFCGRQRFLDVVNAVQRAECTTVERFVGWREGGGSGVEREDRGGNRRDDPRDVPACEYIRAPDLRPRVRHALNSTKPGM